MEFQAVMNIALGCATGIFGWFAREMYGAVQELKTDLYKFREQVARDYIPKNEVQTMREELLSALRRIEDKLEKK
jgi:hypothetical protein